jgi:hypothetical protein
MAVMKKVLLLTGLAVLLAFCVVGAAPIEDVEAAAVYYNADLTAGFLLFTNTTDMAYNALNVVALQSIVVDEEKTLVFGGGEIIGIVPTMQNSFWTIYLDEEGVHPGGTIQVYFTVDPSWGGVSAGLFNAYLQMVE